MKTKFIILSTVFLNALAVGVSLLLVHTGFNEAPADGQHLTGVAHHGRVWPQPLAYIGLPNKTHLTMGTTYHWPLPSQAGNPAAQEAPSTSLPFSSDSAPIHTFWRLYSFQPFGYVAAP